MRTLGRAMHLGRLAEFRTYALSCASNRCLISERSQQMARESDPRAGLRPESRRFVRVATTKYATDRELQHRSCSQ